MTRLLILGLACCLVASAQALELELTQRYSLNRPASLDYDPAFCGLWIANEGPEAILATLDGLELRRIGSDLYRIKAISLEGDTLIVADGGGSFQRLTKDGTALGEPFRIEGGWADTEGIAVGGDGTLLATAPLMDYGIDAEGIAIRPGSNQLFIAFDQGAAIAAFDYTPTLPEGHDPPPPAADCVMF